MTGVLIPVVGPSGAGKDTLIDAARLARPDIFFPVRVITRCESAGGEMFNEADAAAFEQMVDNGDFAFHWQAHGLSYGIPVEIITRLESGQNVMFNGSRGIINEARTRFENLQVMVVTAPEDVLAKRLAARGREDENDIKNRLKRAVYNMPEGDDVTIVWNDVPLASSSATFLAALPPRRSMGSV